MATTARHLLRRLSSASNAEPPLHAFLRYKKWSTAPELTKTFSFDTPRTASTFTARVADLQLTLGRRFASVSQDGARVG